MPSTASLLVMPRALRGCFLALLCLGTLTSGCRKSISINGQDVKQNKRNLTSPPAGATAIDLPDGFSTANRTYFQSRSVLIIQIPATTLQVGDTFSLRNQSVNQVLVDHQSAGAGLTDTAGLELRQNSASNSDLDGYDFSLRIYPTDPANAGKLVYGKNNLQLTVDSAQPKTAEKSIYLKDFRLMSMQASHFSEQVQRSHGFQGEVSVVHNPVSSNGQQMLTTGLIPNLNH